VVYDISRFSRKVLDFVTLHAQLLTDGILLRSATQPIDETPTGKLMGVFHSAISDLDNDVRAEKTVDGMQARIDKKGWPFQPPLGYLKVKHPVYGSSLQTDLVVGPLIRSAFEMVAEGLPQTEALDRLWAAGLRTRKGQRVSPQTFTNILRNEAYAGWLVVKKWDRRVLGGFEPIVSQELFDRVAMKTGGTLAGGIRRRTQDGIFPLRRFVRCGVCDTVLTGSTSKGRSGRYPYYHCRRGCKGSSVPKGRLEQQFAELLRRLVPDPSYWPLCREVVTDLWKEDEAASFHSATLLRTRRGDLAPRWTPKSGN
jgi:hypothetical protein